MTDRIRVGTMLIEDGTSPDGTQLVYWSAREVMGGVAAPGSERVAVIPLGGGVPRTIPGAVGGGHRNRIRRPSSCGTCVPSTRARKVLAGSTTSP